MKIPSYWISCCITFRVSRFKWIFTVIKWGEGARCTVQSFSVALVLKRGWWVVPWLVSMWGTGHEVHPIHWYPSGIHRLSPWVQSLMYSYAAFDAIVDSLFTRRAIRLIRNSVVRFRNMFKQEELLKVEKNPRPLCSDLAGNFGILRFVVKISS